MQASFLSTRFVIIWLATVVRAKCLEIGPAATQEEEAALQLIRREPSIQMRDDDQLLYKYLLLQSGPQTIFFPDDPRTVIVTKMSIVVAGREDLELDLTDPNQDMTLQVKEGAFYRIKITFYVQREIVTGLKLLEKVSRKGIRVSSTTHMVGSYGPKAEPHEYLTPEDEFPTGMLLRGYYNVNSRFVDDDRNEYKAWNWTFKIAKEWN